MEKGLEQKYLLCLIPKYYFYFPQKNNLAKWETLGSMQADTRVSAQCIKKPERDKSGIFHMHLLRHKEWESSEAY